MLFCGICKQPLGPNETLRDIRLTVEDMEGQAFPIDKKPGLYAAGPQMFNLYAPIVAARLGKRVEEMGPNDYV